MDVEAHERCDGSGIWEISCILYSTQYTVAQVRQSAQSAIAVVVSLYIIFHNAAEGRQVHYM